MNWASLPASKEISSLIELPRLLKGTVLRRTLEVVRSSAAEEDGAMGLAQRLCIHKEEEDNWAESPDTHADAGR